MNLIAVITLGGQDCLSTCMPAQNHEDIFVFADQFFQIASPAFPLILYPNFSNLFHSLSCRHGLERWRDGRDVRQPLCSPNPELHRVVCIRATRWGTSFRRHWNDTTNYHGVWDRSSAEFLGFGKFFRGKYLLKWVVRLRRFPPVLVVRLLETHVVVSQTKTVGHMAVQYGHCLFAIAHSSGASAWTISPSCTRKAILSRFWLSDPAGLLEKVMAQISVPHFWKASDGYRSRIACRVAQPRWRMALSSRSALPKIFFLRQQTAWRKERKELQMQKRFSWGTRFWGGWIGLPIKRIGGVYRNRKLENN